MECVVEDITKKLLTILIMLCFITLFIFNTNAELTHFGMGQIYGPQSPQLWYYHGTYDRAYFAGAYNFAGDTAVDPVAYYYDYDTDTWSAKVQIATGSGDDHGAAAIVVNSSGYCHVWYGAHHSQVQYKRATIPENISSWGSGTMPSDSYCELQPFIKPNDEIWMFFNDNVGDYFSYTKSTNNGTSWSSVTAAVSNSGCGSRHILPTDALYNEQTGRIHIAWTNYVGGDRQNLYYAYTPDNGSTWYNASGSSMGNQISGWSEWSSCMAHNASSSYNIPYNYGASKYFAQKMDIDENDRPWIGGGGLATDDSATYPTLCWYNDSGWQIQKPTGSQMTNNLQGTNPDWQGENEVYLYAQYNTSGIEGVHRCGYARCYLYKPLDDSWELANKMSTTSSNHSDFARVRSTSLQFRPDEEMRVCVSCYCNPDYSIMPVWSWGGAWNTTDDDNISITSINNQQNNTVLHSLHRTFNWTKMENSGRYQLQVSNTSNFATTFINLTNISANNARLLAMKGCSYTENETIVTFSLPYKYNVTYPNTHYYRVRSYDA